MHLGNWQLDAVSGGRFWLDGGVMFGVVPKSLWEKVAPPDEQNRICVENRCILARDGRHTILLDTGYGGKYGPLDRKFYSLDEGEPIVGNLAAVGVATDQIDLVVLSHLHFDHAGGTTRFDGRRRLVPTFPRARHVICHTEWEDALAQTPELKSAYALNNLLPLKESGRVELVSGDAPIVPGLEARRTGGHTRGHMALLFQSAGHTAAYLGDLCPSTAHLRRMWCLSYDVFPLETRRAKPRWLGDAADQQWWILWNHDPQIAASRVARDPRREFVVCDPRPSLEDPA